VGSCVSNLVDVVIDVNFTTVFATKMDFKAKAKKTQFLDF